MVKKGLIFSQPALGIGQLLRSLYISQSLVEHVSVDFLLGAPEVPFPIESPRFHLYRMPPLWIRSWQDPPKLEDPFGKYRVEEIFEQRARFLNPILESPYDFVLIELYPFSKWVFGKEIDGLIKKAKKVNPHCKIFCSLRDIVDKKPLEDEKQIVAKVNEYFDAIFVHADPSVVKLEDSFSLTDELRDKIVYTGYVANPVMIPDSGPRKKRVVVSAGSGAYGYELPRAVSLAAIFIPEYEFVFILGPKSPPEVRQSIEYAVSSLELRNIKIVDFLPNFYSVLSESSLSISLGGSTIVDIIATRTPALVYTDAHVEHVFRAKRFADKGVITLLQAPDLHPDRLCPLIRRHVSTPFQDAPINVSGAQQTTREILRITTEAQRH